MNVKIVFLGKLRGFQGCHCTYICIKFIGFVCKEEGISTGANGVFFLEMYRLRIFQIELVLPFDFRISERTCSFSASLISRLTSWRKWRYAFQCNLSLVFIALLCHISRVFINPLISVDTNGLGLEWILICLMGAWLSKTRYGSVLWRAKVEMGDGHEIFSILSCLTLIYIHVFDSFLLLSWAWIQLYIAT